MYPDFSYILHRLIGTQPDNAFSIIKTFGLFLVIAILTAALMLYYELKRKEKEGFLKPQKVKVTEGLPATSWELLSNGLLGFVLGFKFVYILFNFANFQLDPAAVILSGTGNWVGGIIGAALFAGLKYYEKKRVQLDKPLTKDVLVYPHDRIGDITIVAAISGVIGSKIFAMAEDLGELLSGQISLADFFSQFLSGSGMAIYGGLIVAFLVCYFYLKRKNIAPLHVIDGVAPALFISYGIGRMGCHLSGDGDWGIASDLANRPGWLSFLPDWLWSFTYPHNVIHEGIRIADCSWRYCSELAQGVYPTSVYETIMAFLLGALLWSLRKRIRIPGLLFFLYVFLNGFERFWIEKIRINDRYDIFGIQTTQAEFIAVVLMLIGLAGVAIVWQRRSSPAA